MIFEKADASARVLAEASLTTIGLNNCGGSASDRVPAEASLTAIGLFLDPCRYQRREWQLAVGLLSLGRTCLDVDVDVLIGNCSG